MSEIYPTSIPGCQLRFAAEDDLPSLMKFVKELAEYVELLDEVEVSEQEMRKNLFGPKPHAEVVLAMYNKKPVGFALFFHSFSTFLGKPGIYLEDLFVMPAFRGKGIGKSLLSFLAETAVSRNCGRLEWSVLDWNTRAVEFYKKLGAQPMDESTVFRLTGKSLKSAAHIFDKNDQ